MESGSDGEIEILGWVDRRTVRKKLQAADALVLPSYSEGLPMSLLEAMGSGLAVLTTPVGGIPEIVKNNENGLLVEPGNVPELQHALERLTDKALRRSLGDAAAASVTDLSVEEFGTRLLRIYSQWVTFQE